MLSPPALRIFLFFLLDRLLILEGRDVIETSLLGWSNPEPSTTCTLSSLGCSLNKNVTTERHYLRRIRRIKRCGFIGGNVFLGWALRLQKPRLYDSLCVDQDVACSYCSRACLLLAVLPTDEMLPSVRVALVLLSLHSNRAVTKTGMFVLITTFTHCCSCFPSDLKGRN